MELSGTFEVKITPLETYASETAGSSLGRMSLDKTYSGDLEASSQGEMLTGMSQVTGSAGYVAMEKVTGTLRGKRGSFLLQHFGTMRGADSRLILEVVPDSGSEELTGLSGTLQIRVEDGQHRYTMTATFPE